MKHTWHQATNRWLIEMAWKRTILEDSAKIKHLLKYFGNCELTAITRAKIQGFVAVKQQEGLKPATINRWLSLIKAIMNKAYNEWEWVENKPYIKLLRESPNRTRWLTEEEICKIRAHLPSYLQDMMDFTLATGQRADNLCTLTWDQIDLDRQIWTIPAGQFKQGREHIVPLNKKAMDIIYRRVTNLGITQPVFTNNGHRIAQCNTKTWRRAIRLAGIEDFRWHDLRHTWATNHLRAGTPLHVLQRLGGWASLAQVMRYAHHDITTLKEAAENIS